jgi:hypothetical protein
MKDRSPAPCEKTPRAGPVHTCRSARAGIRGPGCRMPGMSEAQLDKARNGAIGPLGLRQEGLKIARDDSVEDRALGTSGSVGGRIRCREIRLRRRERKCRLRVHGQNPQRKRCRRSIGKKSSFLKWRCPHADGRKSSTGGKRRDEPRSRPRTCDKPEPRMTRGSDRPAVSQ